MDSDFFRRGSLVDSDSAQACSRKWNSLAVCFTLLLYCTLRLYDKPDHTVVPDCTGGSAVRHISGKKQECIFAERLHVEVPDAPSMHLVGHVARVLAKQMSRLLQGSVLTMAQALKLGLSPMRFLVPKMVRVYDLL